MTPARLRWGLLLVQVGILILLVNMDVVSDSFVVDLAAAIPLLLIAVGIEKIFTRTRAEVVSYLAVGLIFVGGIFIAVQGSQGGSFFHKTSYTQEFDPSVEEIRATLRLGDSDLTIRDVTDEIVRARFAEFMHKPRIRYDVENKVAELRFQQGHHGFWGGAIKVDLYERDDWTVYFSRVIPLFLECYGDDADIHLNLATTPIRDLKLDADDSQIYIKVGDKESLLKLHIFGNGSDLRLRLPGGAAVKIDAREFDSYLERLGFVRNNGDFISEDYDSLASQIQIELDEHLDNLKIEFY